MNKTRQWLGPIGLWILTATMSATTLTSCDMEFDSSDDRNPEEYHAQVAKNIDGFVMWIFMYNFAA